MHWQWMNRINQSGVWVALTPFGPIHIEQQGAWWVCIKHPREDYAYLNAEIRELTYAQAKAEVAYYRALDQAVKERDAGGRPSLYELPPIKDAIDKAVADITAAEDEEWARLAREQIERQSCARS